jgi:hypothetical protein
MCDPRRLTTLWASKAGYMDSFTFNLRIVWDVAWQKFTSPPEEQLKQSPAFQLYVRFGLILLQVKELRSLTLNNLLLGVLIYFIPKGCN